MVSFMTYEYFYSTSSNVLNANALNISLGVHTVKPIFPGYSESVSENGYDGERKINE